MAAISWLNDSSSAAFYLVKVEAVRIDSSRPAPLLTVIVGPSEEKSEVAATNREFADRELIRQRWWEMLVNQPDAKLHAHISPGVYSWIGTSSGVRGLNLNYVVAQDECAAELYIDRGKNSEEENKAIFDQLFTHKAKIEQDFGAPLSWERLDAKRACRVRATLPGGYGSPEEEWGTIQTSLVQTMNRLEKALRPYLKSLKIGTREEP